MRELARTNDLVLVSFIEALLRGEGIAFHVADAGISSVEGSIGAFPRRILVAEAQHAAARVLLTDCGLAEHLPADDTLRRDRR